MQGCGVRMMMMMHTQLALRYGLRQLLMMMMMITCVWCRCFVCVCVLAVPRSQRAATTCFYQEREHQLGWTPFEQGSWQLCVCLGNRNSVPESAN